MFDASKYSAIKKFSILKWHRHVGAIATLVLMSLLTSTAGLPSHHIITNCWDGFVWGIADPVLNLNRLVNVVAIGLLAAGMVRGYFITVAFVLAATLGSVMHLLPINFTATEIAIAISSIAFGIILVSPNRLHWLILALLGAIAGLLQGYMNAEQIIGAEIITFSSYLLGSSLTQYAVAMSAREIGNNISVGNIENLNGVLPKIFRVCGFAFCAIGVVFLSRVIN